MAIKLKKRKPWVTFTFFFIAVNLLLASLGVAGVLTVQEGIDIDYKYSSQYGNAISRIVEEAYRVAIYDGISPANGSALTANDAPSITREGDDLLYYIECASGGNWRSAESKARSAKLFLEETTHNMRYGVVLQMQGNTVYEEQWINGAHSTRTRILDNTLYSWQLAPEMRELLSKMPTEQMPVICIAVLADTRLHGDGALHGAYYQWQMKMLVLAGCAMAAGIALLILLIVACKHKSLALANAALARRMGKLWLEVKLLLTAGAVLGVGASFWALLEWQELPMLLLLLLCCWWFWLVLVDLLHNKAQFFTHNILHSILRLMKRLESNYDFLERMKRRFILLIAAEAALVLLFLILLLIPPIGWFADLLLLVAGIYLLVRYVGEYNRNMDEFGLIMDYTHQIKEGVPVKPLCLPPEDDFAPLARDLSDIHSGISNAVEEQVRSQRMKVELITNVSHDLKTPLTSIINYVDLLGKEDLQPEYANDYVKVLAQKADRLKNLVQDLFEVSKANSGNADFMPEVLDVIALLEQTVAELDGGSNTAKAEIKEQYACPHLYVYADGKKLHRVFENLLGNALKYSLEGTRVYVTAQNEGGAAQITFKNVSSYEMTFTPEEIVERFQRGDTSRTSEGSGLGLAIAKSFLELCGGALSIELDGDLFKATAALPLSTQQPPVKPALEESVIVAAKEEDPPCKAQEPPQEAEEAAAAAPQE